MKGGYSGKLPKISELRFTRKKGRTHRLITDQLNPLLFFALLSVILPQFQLIPQRTDDLVSTATPSKGPNQSSITVQTPRVNCRQTSKGGLRTRGKHGPGWWHRGLDRTHWFGPVPGSTRDQPIIFIKA